MAKRQTRPLTPAEAVRQGRKLIAERLRQEAANPRPAAGRGGDQPAIGMPIWEQDQRVEVVPEVRATEPTLIFAATIEAAKVNTHPDGAWPIADLRTRQCRFACTDDRAPADQHRFCGRRTHVGPGNLHGSWCDEHLPRVWGQGSVSERNAHRVTKDVRRFG
ncbi:hypothetical protein ACUXK4_004869 [Methylorubrum extorquens]